MGSNEPIESTITRALHWTPLVTFVQNSKITICDRQQLRVLSNQANSTELYFGTEKTQYNLCKQRPLQIL